MIAVTTESFIPVVVTTDCKCGSCGRELPAQTTLAIMLDDSTDESGDGRGFMRLLIPNNSPVCAGCGTIIKLFHLRDSMPSMQE